jgi:hypothetical protein
MQTFAQFIAEATYPSHFGFLKPGGKPIKFMGTNQDGMTHHILAQQHGFKDAHDARAHSHVQYDHNFNYEDFHGRKRGVAGYGFSDSPEARATVKKHLEGSRGLHHVYIDIHHPHNPDVIHSWNGSVEAAQKHLDTHPPVSGDTSRIVEAQVTPEEKWSYEGPREKVPFPLHDWRNKEHPHTIPGVDREQAKRLGKTTKVALADLHATQSHVRQIDLDHKPSASEPKPLVVKKGGKMWIQDGHHRLTQSYKLGKTHDHVTLVDKDR